VRQHIPDSHLEMVVLVIAAAASRKSIEVDDYGGS
jgi:hypothetical protein